MIKPIGERVLLKPKDITPDTNIVIPEAKERPQFGEVIDTNKGAPVKVGDTVAYNYFEFDEVNYKGEEYLIVKYENLLATVHSD